MGVTENYTVFTCYIIDDSIKSTKNKNMTFKLLNQDIANEHFNKRIR